MPATSFIATLGSEAQVVTLTLDGLARQGLQPGRVILLHGDPASEPIAPALALLHADGLRFESRVFQRGGLPLGDIRSEAEAGAALRLIYATLEAEKAQGAQVHLSASGGRKAMAMYAMLAAQLLFDAEDCLWNLVSSDALRLSRRLHAGPGDEVALVRVPVLPWQPQFAAKRRFVESTLTPQERAALQAAVEGGLGNAELAARLYKSEKTIEKQISAVYAKFAEAFAVERPDRRTLAAEFEPYFAVMAMLESGD